MKKHRKILSLILSISILLISATPLTASAFDSIDADDVVELITPSSEAIYTEIDCSFSQTIDEILIDYYSRTQIQNALQSNDICSERDVKADNSDVVEHLNSAGFQAYRVNSETYSSLEQALNTDFDIFNLNPNSSYIVVVSGEENRSTSTDDEHGVPGVSFYHTVDGTRYYLRYFTITAEYDPLFAKANSVNLINTKSRDAIINCLDTAISLVMSEFCPVLGVVSSLCGLSIGDFGTTQPSTLDFHGGTNWTRVYTQVWDPDFEMWVNGACVEYVTAKSMICGLYYSSATNSYQSVSENENSQVTRSPKYYDYSWRKDMAVYGARNFAIQYDCVGDVQYKYGGSVIITHRENF